MPRSHDRDPRDLPPLHPVIENFGNDWDLPQVPEEPSLVPLRYDPYGRPAAFLSVPPPVNLSRLHELPDYVGPTDEHSSGHGVSGPRVTHRRTGDHAGTWEERLTPRRPEAEHSVSLLHEGVVAAGRFTLRGLRHAVGHIRSRRGAGGSESPDGGTPPRRDSRTR